MKVKINQNHRLQQNNLDKIVAEETTNSSLVVESVFDFNFFDVLTEAYWQNSRWAKNVSKVKEPGKHQRVAAEREIEDKASAEAAEQTRIAKEQEAGRAEIRRQERNRDPEFVANIERRKQVVTARAIFNNAPSQFPAFNLLRHSPSDKK